MFKDLKNAWSKREIWMRMGLNEIRRGYRRTIIGPFWVTITMGLFIGTLGILYSSFWNKEVSEYLPYLCAGFLAWIPITAIINEGCSLFINNEHIIKQIHPPYSMFALALVYRHLIMFFHHMVIFLILVFLLPIPVNLNTLLFFPGLLFLLLNGVWIALLVGLINTRFRDVQPLVASIMQLMFFLTPVFWMPELVGEDRKIFIDINPFYHFLEIIRDPLLGLSPLPETWIFVLCTTVLGWLSIVIFFSKYRWRIAYWL